MNNSLDDSSRIARYGRWLLRRRWAVMAGTLAVTAVLAAGVRGIRFAGDYRIFFSEGNPLLEAFDELQDTYVKNENVLFVLTPADGDVFTARTLAAIETLTERAWQIPYSTRVDSLANFQHTRSDEDELIVEELVVGAADLGPERLAEIRRIALSEPRLVQRLVSPTGHVAGVSALVQHEGDSPERLVAAVTAAREIAAAIEEEYPGVDVRLTGAIMLHNAFMEATQHDLATLIPLMYLGIVVFMACFLRSLAATFATVVVILLSAAMAIGAAGWMKVALTPISAVAPTLVMTLAVADSIHLLTSFLQELRRGRPQHEAIVESLRINFQPMFLTSITTAIGFLSMNASDAPPLHDLGNITAVGVIVAFATSVSFLPALMAVLPVRVPGRRTSSGSEIMARLADFVIRRRRPLLAVSIAAVAILGAFIPANEFNDNYTEYFDESVAFRADTDYAVANLTGVYQVEYSLRAATAGGVSDPAYLAQLDRFAEWWRRQPETLHVDSFSDTVKRLNQSMHGDDPRWYRLPESRELAAQYLLLYELSLPYGLDLTHQITVDKSATRLSVTLKEISSREVVDVADRGEAWLAENAPTMSAEGVGPTVMFSHLSIQNTYSMVSGTSLALALISVILVVALRSLKFGALSLVANLAPPALGFGIWGLAVGRVGFLLSIVLAMTLGIVVDDTVHFLSKYLRARRERGMTPEDAVRYTFATVGWALTTTTLVLAGGFLILSFSTFAQNHDMGRLTAMILILALAADFFLLPPLLLLLGRSPSRARGAGGSTAATIPTPLED